MSTKPCIGVLPDPSPHLKRQRVVPMRLGGGGGGGGEGGGSAGEASPYPLTSPPKG